MKEFENLKALVDSLESDVTKFVEKGNSSAGTRVSKSMGEIIKLAKEVRSKVFAIKKETK